MNWKPSSRRTWIEVLISPLMSSSGRLLKMLHEQEQWLADNHADIAAKIEEGYASAERGELLDHEQVRTLVNERKRAWRNEN